MHKVLRNVEYWRVFLVKAEEQFANVFRSASDHGDKWRLLPEAFNTRKKIYNYFTEYWSSSYAKIMLCNLKTKEINHKLYVIEGDIGPTPGFRDIQINQFCRNCYIIHTKLGFEWEKEEELRPVTYIIKRRKRKYIIVERIYNGYDFRFTECKNV